MDWFKVALLRIFEKAGISFWKPWWMLKANLAPRASEGRSRRPESTCTWAASKNLSRACGQLSFASPSALKGMGPSSFRAASKAS